MAVLFHPSLRRFCFSILPALWMISAAPAQSTIPLSELPPPPKELKELIETGKIRFLAGPPEPGHGSDGAAIDSSPSADGQTNRVSFLAAKTIYDIDFNFQTQTAWQFFPAQRELRIQVRVKRYRWEPTHQVWFRRRPADHNFWTNRLVLHEFDHVRLSADPRWKARFDELIRKPITIRHKLDVGEVANQRLVNQLANESIESQFQQAHDLIEIRYQELDRQTNHGRRQLPEESELYDLLRTSDESEK